MVFSKDKKGASADSRVLKILRGYTPALFLLAVVSLILGIQAARLQMVLAEPSAPSSKAIPTVSPAAFAEPSADSNRSEEIEISQLAPQQQAEQLLERAIQKADPSIALIQERLDGWRGRVQSTDQLFRLVLAALKSDDPRVRAAAIEIDLASSGLSKSSQSINLLEKQLRSASPIRSLALWRLGALGNRGVQPARVLGLLLLHTHDRDIQSRYWAVEGLAMLGTDASIGPLLSILARDPSFRVRERAACSLSQSGMLTYQQRLSAVPDLLNLVDDDSVDSATRGLIYNSLRVITGASIENNPDAWRNWWAHRDPASKPSHPPANLILA